MGTYGAVQIPPTREHDTGGAWVLDHFHAFAVAMGAPDQERLRRCGVECVCLVALFQLCDVRHTFCKLIHTDPCLT